MGGMHSVCVYGGCGWGVCIVYVCMEVVGGMHSVCVYEGALWGVCIVYVCMRGRCGGYA